MPDTDSSDSPAPDYWSRVQLALSILDHRTPCALTCELAALALRGESITYLREYERQVAA